MEEILRMFHIKSFIGVDEYVAFLFTSECTPGFFGLDCSERCSGNCENNKPCDHISGVCPGGCQDSYIDEYCNSCKNPSSLF